MSGRIVDTYARSRYAVIGLKGRWQSDISPSSMKETHMTTNPLVGTWKLVSFEVKGPDGCIHYPLGRDPVGYIGYSEDGHMHVAMMKANRPRTGADMLSLASTEEKAAAAATFVSYCGRYEIKGDRVIHHAEVSLDPNVTGEPVERMMQISGNRLSLTMPPFPIFGEPHTGHLVWGRV